MSILIKRMEMPDDCRNCPFETYYMNCGETRCRATGKILADFYKPIPFEGRAEECPLIEVPSADVAEVVRCKDCKNNYVTTHNHGKQDDPRCDFIDRHLSLDDFCSRGERRMDGE